MKSTRQSRPSRRPTTRQRQPKKEEPKPQDEDEGSIVLTPDSGPKGKAIERASPDCSWMELSITDLHEDQAKNKNLGDSATTLTTMMSSSNHTLENSNKSLVHGLDVEAEQHERSPRTPEKRETTRRTMAMPKLTMPKMKSPKRISKPVVNILSPGKYVGRKERAQQTKKSEQRRKAVEESLFANLVNDDNAFDALVSLTTPKKFPNSYE